MHKIYLTVNKIINAKSKSPNWEGEGKVHVQSWSQVLLHSSAVMIIGFQLFFDISTYTVYLIVTADLMPDSKCLFNASSLFVFV